MKKFINSLYGKISVPISHIFGAKPKAYRKMSRLHGFFIRPHSKLAAKNS